MAKNDAPLIDDKLARELYRPPPPEPRPEQPPQAKVELQRFQVLEQLIRDNPANPQPYSELAEIYLAQQRLKDAARVLQRAVQFCGEAEDLLFRHEDVRLKLSHGSWQATLAEYERFETEANREECRRAEAEYFALQHAVAQARQARHPDNPDWAILSAAAMRRLGRGEEAIAKLEPLKSHPRVRPQASLLLGQCLEDAGRIVDALAAYRRAAIFRAPPPPDDVRRAALRRAADLAAKHELFASAAKYVELLTADMAADDAELPQLRLKLERHLAAAAAQRGEPSGNISSTPRPASGRGAGGEGQSEDSVLA